MIAIKNYFFVSKISWCSACNICWHSTQTFVGAFADTLSAAFIISPHIITELSIILPNDNISLTSKIPKKIYFTCMMLFQIFALSPTFIIIPILIQITLSAIKFTLTFAWYLFRSCFWFNYSCYHIKNT